MEIHGVLLVGGWKVSIEPKYVEGGGQMGNGGLDDLEEVEKSDRR